MAYFKPMTRGGGRLETVIQGKFVTPKKNQSLKNRFLFKK